MYRMKDGKTVISLLGKDRERAEIALSIWRVTNPNALLEQATWATDDRGYVYVACWTPVLEVR